jgi:predicted dehydrogenase
MDWNHMLFIDRDNPIPTNSQLLNFGSFIHDMSGHTINFLLLMTEGETPYKVLASATPVYQTGVVDHCELTFFYKTATKTRTVKFDLSRKSPYNVFDTYVEVSSDTEILMGDRDPAGGYSFPNRFEEAFIDEMKYFREVVEAGKNATHLPPKSPPKDDIATSK